MILRTTNLLLLIFLTGFSAVEMYEEITEKKTEQITFEEPDTTGEFPIESFFSLALSISSKTSIGIITSKFGNP